jgi:hypothetical protein
MTVGLLDKDIPGEVLAKHSQLKTFDQTFDLIQALEDGKQAKSQLSRDESSISSQRSAYKHIQKPSSTDKQTQPKIPCSHGTPRNTASFRAAHSPSLNLP